MMKLPQLDAGAAHVRKEIAIRRAGVHHVCDCGETRPEAFETNKRPIICAGCTRKKKGKTVMDDHHIAGKSNSAITIGIHVNDHRAELTVAQQDWPRNTLENPDGSPLLSGAAHIRGFIDTHIYLIRTLLLWVAEMLETLDSLLISILGPTWWEKTNLRQFTPSVKSEKKEQPEDK
jgi:hypothetical protein